MKRLEEGVACIRDNSSLEDKRLVLNKMINNIYVERINRTKAKIYIMSKMMGEYIYLVDTYHKKWAREYSLTL